MGGMADGATPAFCKPAEGGSGAPQGIAFLSYGCPRRPDVLCSERCPTLTPSAARRRVIGVAMLKYAIVFAVISLIAGALGFGGVAAGAAGIAKVLFGLFLVLAVIFLVLAALGVGAVRKAID